MTTYTGTDSADTFTGGTGSDTFIGRGGNDTLTGGGGNDVFVYDTRGFGNDRITDFNAGDRIDLSFLKVADLDSLRPFMQQDGADVVINLAYFGSTESIRLVDTNLNSLTASSFIFNTSATALNVTGTDYGDVLFGGNGADRLAGGNGNDTLVGGANIDQLTGGGGNDTLIGGTGNDIFVYNNREFGNDTITDFTAGDRIDLSALNVGGLDSLAPFMQQDGADVVITLGYFGSTESIRLIDTNLNSLSAASFIFSTSTTALNVTGTDYRDVLFGGNGADRLAGGNGNDTLVGGTNIDQLTGGGGNDTLIGGAGNDIFIYNTREFGNDTITDFANGDRIDLSGLNIGDFASLQPFMQQSGADVVITLGYFGSTESIRIVDTTLASLTAASFVFNTFPTALNLTGTDYRDVMFGGNAADRLAGKGGNDTLVGGVGDDQLTGGSGDDTLTGGTGKDIFIYNTREFGNDRITDFAVGDKIDVSGLNIGDFASLQPFMQQSGADVVITLGYFGSTESIRIVNTTLASLTAASFVFNTFPAALTLTGTDYRDVLFGANGADHLAGAGGNDTVVGGAGNDQLRGDAGDDLLMGGAGADALDGGAGIDTASYATSVGGVNVNLATGLGAAADAGGDTLTGIENLIGGRGNDWLRGDINANVLTGALGNDTLEGNAGNDRLDGGDGNDVLTGGVGADVLIGGAGIDTASYAGSTGGVNVNLATGLGASADAGGDTLTGIENLNGGIGNDWLRGDINANALTGNAGSDTLEGNAGNDRLDGGDGNDVLTGGAGADVLIGGAGIDTANYATSGGGVNVNLATGLGGAFEASGDTLTGIENVIGSGGNDWLRGDGGANTLTGNAGNDTLEGNAGNDLLIGGARKDTLTGGAGADRFGYAAIGDSTVGAAADTIADFSHAQGDRIDLASIDANSVVAGNQAFSFIGAAAFGHHAGELRFDIVSGVTSVYGDVNGDGAADFQIRLSGAVPLVAADFVL
jgi:Ca2+-binding RTX toxin-like protein